MRSALVTGCLLLSCFARVHAINSVDHPDKVSVGLERPRKISLDGDWAFQTDPQDVGEREQWFAPGKVAQRRIKVPLPWELGADDLREYSGVAWYSREVEIPTDFARQRTALGFHGIAHHAKVYVNGQLAGEHTGAQAPFLLDVTRLLKTGRTNTITVRVYNPLKGVSFYLDSHSLLKVSGLWRSVWLEASGLDFISDLFMIPDVDKSRATARVTVCVEGSSKSKTYQLAVRLTDRRGRRFEQSQSVEVAARNAPAFYTRDVLIDIPDALLWDVDQPHLYSIEANLLEQGRSVDEVRDHFGMRKIEAKNGRLYLNNKVFYLVGGGIDPLPYGGSGDVNWFLPGPYAYPTDDETRDDIRKIKSLGINLVRIPLRPMHPQWMRLADELGLLVWQEASWTKFNNLEGYQNTWSEVLLRDRNHPSAAIWTLFNESWGLEYVTSIYQHVKKLDPTRPILDNTGGVILSGANYPGNHHETDIEDVHRYPGFNDFSKAYWLSLTRVDPNRPLLVSEFGPIPYQFNLAKFRKAWSGTDPWWFEASPKGGGGMGLGWDHRGIEQRYRSWGLDKIYGDWDQFIQAHDWYYFWGLKDQTQAMRMNNELAGFVAWIWDNGQHGTGAIDNFKQKKVFADELGKIWTQDLVIIDKSRHNYWSGETLYANLYVSHFSGENLAGARVQWALEGSEQKGEIPLADVAIGQARLVGDILLTVPEASEPTQRKLRVKLASRDGRVLSENWELVWLFPVQDRQASQLPIAMVSLRNERVMRVLGYKGISLEEKPSVAVAGVMDDKLENYVRQGGTAILFPAGSDTFLQRFGLKLVDQHLGGHTSMFYARKDVAVFDRVPYSNPYIWQFYKVWPKWALQGIRPEQHDDILAGEYMNLLNRQSGTVVQYRYGKGRVIVCLLGVLEAIHDDPVAMIVMNNLLRYATSDFRPRAELSE